MWNPAIKPRLFTIESLKIGQQRRSEIQHGKSRSPDGINRENIKSNKPDVHYKSGSYLPKHMRLFFSPELVNVPIEDIDTFYSDAKTFVIITEKKILHRFTAKSTLNIFSPFNPIRRTCISVLQNWIYRWFMIVIAFLDCCLFTQPRMELQPIVHNILGAIYTFDFVTNVIAKGLVLDQFSYLRDGWGNVDLLLLVPYYVPHVGRHHFLCGLRSLKIAALIPTLKSMVPAVIRTFVDLRDIFLLMLFATWIFALVGHQFYMGAITQKCLLNFPEDGSVGKARDMKWYDWVHNGSRWVSHPYFSFCGNYTLTWQCSEGYTCLQVSRLDDRLYGSMGWALISTIRLMQQDSWDEIYRDILRTTGPWHILYFALVLFLGSFYTLNMILAVVSKSYDELRKELNLTEKSKCSTINIANLNDNDMERRDISGENERKQDSNCKYSIKKMWTRFMNLINILAFDPFTELIMAFATVVNLILLSMDHFRVEENEQLYIIMREGYEILFMVFAVEGLLKLVACGPKAYFKDNWNMFDFSLLFLSFIEFVFELGDPILEALLSLRSLRVFKLARVWPTLNDLVTGVFSAMGNVSEMTVVAVGVFYIFCVAGMHLFGGNGENGSIHSESLWHFRDFFHSFLVIFRLLCGEWMDTMSECIDDHGWVCIPFFISAVIILNLIVLNLLLVMFLQRFSSANLSKKEKGTLSKPNNVSIVISRFRRLGNCLKGLLATCFGINSSENANTQGVSAIQRETRDSNHEEIQRKKCGCPKLRLKFRTIIDSKYFKRFNIGITIIAAVCLSLRDVSLNSRPRLEYFINLAEGITSVFLGVEAVIKIAAMGFFPYIKIKWNCLDFIILLGSIFNVISSLFEAGTVSFIRSMRVLRLFSNFDGMRVVFNSLGKSMTKIFGVLLVCLLIWLVFAIIGVQLLSGRFHYCSDPYGEYIDPSIIYNKKQCLRYNYEWENSFRNFDNVGSAYYRILEIITFKGWINSLYEAVNSGEIDEQPSFEKSLWISGYFVAVILGGSFFAFNLFIGVLIDGLNEEKRKTEENTNDGFEKTTGYQNVRIYMLQKLKGKVLSFDTSKGTYQKFVLGILASKYFEILVLLNLLFNMILLSLDRSNTNATQKEILLALNGISTGFFTIECLLKIIAMNYQFFRSPRYIYEIFVEFMSLFDLIWTGIFLKNYIVPFRPGLLRLVRFAWISGYLRHFKAANGLWQLISVVKISLPTFFNICVLLFLVVFIYATLGMELFQDVKLKLGLDIVFSFQTLPQAFIVLFPIITSARWDVLMSALTFDRECVHPDAEMNLHGDCGVNPTVAGFFVISYLFITFVIFVNMFSAVILENYSRVMRLVECELGDEQFEMFYKIWTQFDKKNSNFIGYNDLSDLFETFEEPFQVVKPNRSAVSLMNVPVYKDNLVHCADVMDAAITFFFFRKGAISADKFTNYQNELKDEKSCRQNPITTTLRIQRERHCVKTIQFAWKKYKNLAR